MIHRQNYLDVRAYLIHIERVRQNDPLTVKRARGHLRHLLEWADDVPFAKARKIDPVFPAYMLTARSDGRDKPLAPGSIIKGLTNARQFFTFARGEWPLRYKPISDSWIEMLQPPRHIRLDSRLPIREYWTVEDVQKVVSVSTETLRQERGRVAVAMLFLSGMRADALASIPISCVDLPNRTLYQLPEHGVRTKNRKAAKTYLLNIPELIEVVTRWDNLVRGLPSPNYARSFGEGLGVGSLWYATLSRDGMTLTATTKAYTGRGNDIQKDIRLICALVGLPYLSPHKLRHGHTVYALKRADNVAQLKAVSQNIMHKSLVTTDQIYGKLINDDVQDIISAL